MQRILHETNAMGYNLFLTGSDNFRFSIYPEYKANRKDTARPKHYAAIREFLVTDWKAKVTDGIEADDAMGIEQCADPENSIIATIDKDLLMIPGHHYNFVKQERRYVTPMEGLRHFYFQLVMGDKADNIFGYDGVARQKVPKFLEPVITQLEYCATEKEMYDLVYDLYHDKDKFLVNGKCLWIMRREGDFWQGNLMEETGPKDDTTLS